MNARQAKFAEEFVRLNNATQAAISAGYSEKTAKQIGSRLLTVVDVADAIQKLRAKASARAELSTDWVLRRLQEEAEVSNVTTSASRVKALELCGRYLAMWEDRVRLNGKIEHAPTLPVSTLTDDQLRKIQEAVAPLVAADPAAEPRPEQAPR